MQECFLKKKEELKENNNRGNLLLCVLMRNQNTNLKRDCAIKDNYCVHNVYITHNFVRFNIFDFRCD